MFEEFKNYFRWDLSDEYLTIEVKRRFMKKAPILYKSRIYKLKQLYLKKEPKPSNITEHVWNALVCNWKTEAATEASRKAKKNRMSEVELGSGISKTFGGSCSFAEMAARLVEENEGEKVSLDKLYMHTRTKDGNGSTFAQRKFMMNMNVVLNLWGRMQLKRTKQLYFLSVIWWTKNTEPSVFREYRS